MSKGSKRRPEDANKIASNWDRIFGKKDNQRLTDDSSNQRLTDDTSSKQDSEASPDDDKEKNSSTK